MPASGQTDHYDFPYPLGSDQVAPREHIQELAEALDDELLNFISSGGSSTDNAIARFDGILGNIQNSEVTISDTADITTAGDIYADDIELTGLLTVDDVTDSTSTTTGSIQTDGGLGVAKSVYIGAALNVTGDITTDSNGGVKYTNSGALQWWLYRDGSNNFSIRRYIASVYQDSPFLIENTTGNATFAIMLQ